MMRSPFFGYLLIVLSFGALHLFQTRSGLIPQVVFAVFSSTCLVAFSLKKYVIATVIFFILMAVSSFFFWMFCLQYLQQCLFWGGCLDPVPAFMIYIVISLAVLLCGLSVFIYFKTIVS